MYRLERIIDYTLNGQRDICIVFESSELREVTDKLHALALTPHFGMYQIIEEVFITNEYAQSKLKSKEIDRTEHHEVEVQDIAGVSIQSPSRSGQS